MTCFRDLAEYMSIPRVTTLALAPDGCWLAATVSTLTADRKKYRSSIWRVPAGPGAATRLTWSAAGEAGPQFLPDGSLLFLSARPDPGQPEPDENEPAGRTALWRLPAGAGEAVRLTPPAGGVSAVAAARSAGLFAVSAPVLPGDGGAGGDAARRKARSDAGVTAILHDGVHRVRYWDHDLGPDSLRLLTGGVAAEPGDPGDPAGGDPAALAELTDDAGRALDEQDFELSPDGSVLVTGWAVPAGGGGEQVEVAVIDVAARTRATLLAAPDADFTGPRISPDGRQVAAVRTGHDRPERSGDVTLVLAGLSVAGGPAAGRDLLAGFDRRPAELAWSADSGAVYFTADDHGRRPVFRVQVATGELTQVTADDAAYASLCPAPGGGTLYALRSAIGSPPAPVAIDLTVPGASPVSLASPASPVEVPGQVTEVTTAAEDGTPLRGWLVLPEGASAQHPAPLLLWVHGGPQSSWNDWSWRWNPWLMAARGYAVLLPDPALSTGYGEQFIARGYGRWGEAPYTDVLAVTDAALARPDLDAGRTAMMGGSFGGYMANWIAGHTGRFRAIVSHAGLWSLEQFLGTTDAPSYWYREFGDPAARPSRYAAATPDAHASQVTTPMLIIHGDKDYRVPVGEALRLYADLVRRGASVKFLYFPDENHWILRPGDAGVWYETVLAFLAEHVLGEEWQRPALL